ncbi:MAG TPA: flagellar basal-body MS-ring/collar protein FliF [Eoetvoesiella sp.]
MSLQAGLLARFPALSKLTNLPKPIQLGLAAAAVAIIVVLLLSSRAPDYRVLFSNLEDRDGGAIVTALTQMNVPYKFSENGTALMVPADRVHETRLQLAEQGLPRGGDVGFELLDNTRFGASQFTEQVTYQRALEGELVSSIEAVHSVQKARVHLAIPRETLFVRERQAPTASVLLTLYPGRTLSSSQVSAITWLVSSSVPNLNAENVSVVDQNGRLLTAPSGEAGADGTQRSFVNDIEQRTVQRILTLVSPLVGAGNVRAQATADVDFSLREQTSEVYRPNQKPGEAAVRSEQTSNSEQYQVLPPEGVPGALTNQPPANATAPIVTPAPAAGAVPNAAANAANQANAGPNVTATTNPLNAPAWTKQPGNSRHDATINYEVDRTISHIKDPTGKLRRLSVAVVVNYQRDRDGELAPLPAAELDKLNELVKDAMGFSQERGDTLTVINSEFNEASAETLPVWKNPEYQALALALGKYLLIALAVFLVWRKIVRPLVQSAVQANTQAMPAPAAVDDSTEKQKEAEALKRAASMSRYEDNLNTARTMAQKDPRAVAMVLRTWMEKKDGK